MQVIVSRVSLSSESSDFLKMLNNTTFDVFFDFDVFLRGNRSTQKSMNDDGKDEDEHADDDDDGGEDEEVEEEE